MGLWINAKWAVMIDPFVFEYVHDLEIISWNPVGLSQITWFNTEIPLNANVMVIIENENILQLKMLFNNQLEIIPKVLAWAHLRNA